MRIGAVAVDDLAEQALPDHVEHRQVVLAVAPVLQHHVWDPVCLVRIHQAPALVESQCGRDLARSVLAGLHAVDGHDRVPLPRRGDDHRVEVIARHEALEIVFVAGVAFRPGPSELLHLLLRCRQIAGTSMSQSAGTLTSFIESSRRKQTAAAIAHTDHADLHRGFPSPHPKSTRAAAATPRKLRRSILMSIQGLLEPGDSRASRSRSGLPHLSHAIDAQVQRVEHDFVEAKHSGLSSAAPRRSSLMFRPQTGGWSSEGRRDPLKRAHSQITCIAHSTQSNSSLRRRPESSSR